MHLQIFFSWCNVQVQISPVACPMMTVGRENLLTTTYRGMLRKIVGTPRRYLNFRDNSDGMESWVDWVIRATKTAEEEAAKAGLQTWVTIQRDRKQALLRRTTAATDGRWSFVAYNWHPAGNRSVGRPCKRWGDV